MPNITLSVDEEIIKKVRKIAVDKNTTLTEMVREFLNGWRKASRPWFTSRPKPISNTGFPIGTPRLLRRPQGRSAPTFSAKTCLMEGDIAE